MNGLETLSKISGLSKEEIRKIAEDVQKNNAILRDCPLHNFIPKEDSRRKFVCVNCGGVIDSIYKSWYETGLTHGRKNVK